jgi:hypothetical protein
MSKKVCPKCGSDDISDCWCKGRMLQRSCNDCDWKEQPRVPEKISVKTTKKVAVTQFGGFTYEIFDRYGHIMVSSRSYGKKAEMVESLNKEMVRSETDVTAGPYTAVMWDDHVVVKGTVWRKDKLEE